MPGKTSSTKADVSDASPRLKGGSLHAFTDHEDAFVCRKVEHVGKSAIGALFALLAIDEFVTSVWRVEMQVIGLSRLGSRPLSQ